MPNEKIAPPTAPVFLAEAPPRFIQRLDLSRALLDALAAQHSSELGPYIALGRIESTLVAAKVQQRRIESAKRTIARGLRTGGSVRNSMLFHDVHFYVICWARIAKLTVFVRQESRSRRVGLVLRRYNSDLSAMCTFRDHLEHFEERLPGRPKHSSLRAPGDLFNMDGTHATFGGERVDVGPNSCATLASFVGEFRTALLFDSLETLATLDRPRFAATVRRAAVSLNLDRVQKDVQRMLRASSRDPNTPSNRRLHPTTVGAIAKRRE